MGSISILSVSAGVSAAAEFMIFGSSSSGNGMDPAAADLGNWKVLNLLEPRGRGKEACLKAETK